MDMIWHLISYFLCRMIIAMVTVIERLADVLISWYVLRDCFLNLIAFKAQGVFDINLCGDRK